MESPANCGERANHREEQASYFYVVWPEETVTTFSAAGTAGGSPLDPALCSNHHQIHRPTATRPHRQSQKLQQEHELVAAMDHSSVAPPLLSPPNGKPLPEIEVVGSFASPLTSPILSIADTSPLVTQSSVTVHTFTEKRSETGNGSVGDLHEGERARLSCETHPSSPKFFAGLSHNASLPVILQQKNTSVGTTESGGGGGGRMVSKGHGNNGTSTGETTQYSQHEQHDSVSGGGGCRRKRSRMQYYNLNGCLECEVKDAEIKTLRRRIQVMEEVVGLLNQRLSALQQSSSGVLFSPMVMPPVVSQVVIPSSYTTPPTNSIKVHASPVSVVDSNHCTSATSPQVSSDTEDASSDSASIAYAQAELCPPAEQRVELIPGTGVYVTLPQLEEARREAKNGTQLARKLMDAFWDRETLARSSLSSKSKYQYQQLDPNVISAIEAYCLSFDSSTHSRDLHACMTDKCCQARSRRGAPYKALQNGLLHSGVVHNGLHPTMNGGT